MSARKATPTPRGFDNQLAQLEALSASFHAGSPLTAEAIAQLRGALAHSSNFIVAKAARLIAEAGLFPLLPDTLAAYDRFFVDAVKNDPQCWAKNALVKTLVQLEHRQKDAYLRGLRHHQMEPTWGGQSDTAGALRGACTHALVDCPGITDADLPLPPVWNTRMLCRMKKVISLSPCLCGEIFQGSRILFTVFPGLIQKQNISPSACAAVRFMCNF